MPDPDQIKEPLQGLNWIKQSVEVPNEALMMKMTESRQKVWQTSKNESWMWWDLLHRNAHQILAQQDLFVNYKTDNYGCL